MLQGVIMTLTKTNKVRCLKCDDIISSKSVHDFVRCSCGAIAVDGGLEYLRRVGDLDSYEELSVGWPEYDL